MGVVGAALLIGALVVGLGLRVGALNRSGYASARMTLVLPSLAIVVTIGFAVIVAALAPAWRSFRIGAVRIDQRRGRGHGLAHALGCRS